MSPGLTAHLAAAAGLGGGVAVGKEVPEVGGQTQQNPSGNELPHPRPVWHPRTQLKQITIISRQPNNN